MAAVTLCKGNNLCAVESYRSGINTLMIASLGVWAVCGSPVIIMMLNTCR